MPNLSHSTASTLYPALRSYVLECWQKDSPFVLVEFAKRVGQLNGATHVHDAIGSPVRTLLNALRKEGTLVEPSNLPLGRFKTALQVGGMNWTGRPMAGQSLCELVEPFLADPSAPYRSEIKTALRNVLISMLPGAALAGTKKDETLLVAASRIPARQISELAERAKALDCSKRLEYGRYLRHLLEYGMERDLVAVILPLQRDDSPWQLSVDEGCPLGVGPMTSARDQERSALSRLRRALIAINGNDAPETPNDCTPEQTAEALQRVADDGELSRAKAIRGALKRMGRRGYGPYRELKDLSPTKVGRGRTEQTPAFYLSVTGVQASDLASRIGGATGTLPKPRANSWENLLWTLKYHGLPESVSTFVAQYRDYSALTDLELENRSDLPDRLGIRHLKTSAQWLRVRAFRAWLGAAINILGIPAENCTVDVVFGSRFKEIATAIRNEWKRRSDANAELAQRGLPTNGLYHRLESHGMVKLMAAGGLISLFAYDLSRHERDLDTARFIESVTGRNVTLDEEATLLAPKKTILEELFLRAYFHSRKLAGSASKAVKLSGGATLKPKSLIFDEATPSFDLVPAALDDICRRVHGHAKRDDELFADAMETLHFAFLATGQFRPGESAHVRLDRHFSGAERKRGGIHLYPQDRKVPETGEHFVAMCEELTPTWLVDFVIDVARPALLRLYEEDGGASHEFLFTDRRGRPYGDPGEDTLGHVRDKQLLSDRLHKMENMFSRRRARLLSARGVRVHMGHGVNGPHASRDFASQALQHISTVNEIMRLRYLGDGGTGMAARVYSGRSLAMNQETLKKLVHSRPWCRGQEQDLVDVNASRRALLVARYAAGDLAARAFADEISAMETSEHQQKMP